MDLVFKTLSFTNFMSFGQIRNTINLEKPGTCFVTGENLDDGGSSGAGKTTLINAFSYVLFDKVPGKISKERLINRTNKDEKKTLMEVELTLTKGADEYIIKRYRGAETGYRLVHVNNATPNKDITNAGGFNASIEELLGFSYELFKQIIFFDGNSQAFLDMPVGSQRELIEELLKITLLSRKAEALKALNTANEQNIKVQEALIQQRKLQQEKYAKQVGEAEQRVKSWEAQRLADATSLYQQLSKLSSVDFEAEETLHEEIVKLDHEKQTRASDVNSIKVQITAKEREKPAMAADFAIARSTLASEKTNLDQLAREINHLRDAKCPYCLQDYAASKQKLADKEAAFAELTKKHDETTSEHEQLKQAIVVEEERIACELAELKSQHTARSAELHEATLELQEVKQALAYPTLVEALKAKESSHALQERYDQKQLEANPHVDALKALLDDNKDGVVTSELDTLVRLKEHYQLLQKLLTDKNSFIRKAIISKTLPFLNKRIAFYTEQLGLPHVVKFQPDMSCEITQYGRDLDHGNLSNGQKKRLNLSLCFAFRDALTYLHSKVNVLFTDEIDGGSLDEQSVNSMIGLLKHKAWDDTIGIYIISHRPEFDGRCDRNVVVRLEGGFSTLIEQAED